MTATTMNRPATDKQLGLIAKLAGEKALPVGDMEKVLAAVEARTLSTKGASATINKLLALPAASFEPEAGVYVNPDGRVFRVYFGQQSGKMLCAEVVVDQFVYAGQADRFVTAASRKLTLDEAASWGKATGTCIVCARRLDVPESVDRGVGPVCWSRMGGF